MSSSSCDSPFDWRRRLRFLQMFRGFPYTSEKGVVEYPTTEYSLHSPSKNVGIDFFGTPTEFHSTQADHYCMELRQLHYFVAVAEELHCSRSVESSHRTTSAEYTDSVSGARAWCPATGSHDTSRVELTRAGATFYERCVRILSDIDLSTEITRSVAGKTVTRIRIGTIYPATVGVLPAFLARIARKYPEIQLHISSGTTDEIIRGLERSDQSRLHPTGGEYRLFTFSLHSSRALLACGREEQRACHPRRYWHR